jgi:1,2-phenylacetyl-CoA epoxidase catalytic subunit
VQPVPDPSAELHAMPPEAFSEQVHSFEFWFGAVQGYLEGRPYGHSRAAIEPERTEAEREGLVTVLCQYGLGETAALEGASGLIRLAPNRATQVFLSTQTVDEGRHLEVLIHRLRDLGVASPEQEIERRASPELRRFRERLLGFIDSGDWEAALFAQNVILEAAEFAVFHRHARSADPITREVLLGIIKDERRHVGFGENTIGRCLAGDPSLKARLRTVRDELDPLVLESFTRTLDALGTPATERSELGRDYLSAVGRLGIT